MSKDGTKRSARAKIICAAACLLVIAAPVAFSACSSTTGNTTAATDAGATPTPTNEYGIVTAEQWEAEYPEQVETFAMTVEDKDTVDYLEENPFLSTIYNGSAFAKSYESARGHAYALEDVKSTPRISEKSKATCFSCKTPQYTKMEETEGEKLYKTSFADVKDEMTMNLTCYDCHENSPESEPVSIRSHFNNAFGDLVERDRIDASSASCAQCHNEYYFDADTGAVTLPQHLTSPTDILEYYNGINFTDYENPDTGTKQLKAQHPEFQMYSGSIHERSGLSCADCHMEKTTKNGKTVTSHKVMSPLESETIMNDVCLGCHVGENAESLSKRVTDLQKPIDEATTAGGNLLETLTTKLTEANKSGAYSEAELNKVRSLNRDSQWLWDWVFVENSSGFHNSGQAEMCLNESATLAQQAIDLLNK